MTRILLVHYTPPSVVGGVESVMGEHARLLRERGYDVRIVAGRADDDPELTVIPEIDAAQPVNRLLEAELMSGRVPEEFTAVREKIERRLAPLANSADVVIVHNAFTLHFSLPLSDLLFDLAQTRRAGSTIAWCHDLSWTNPLYIAGMFESRPWNLLRRPAPGVTYVTVSELRRRELASLWGGAEEQIIVVPNGVDAAEFLRLSSETLGIAERFGLWDRDVVLLLPVRATRRKNVEAAVGAVRALVDQGQDAILLVSGPTEAHHPQLATSYRRELEELAESLGVEQRVVFLAHALARNLPYRTIAELFALADVLIFPSLQEGFGVPILEAGLSRVPVVLSDIPIFQEVAGDEGRYFSLDASPAAIADVVLSAMEAPTSRLFRRVMRSFRWEAIADQYLVPLVEIAARSREESA